MSKHDILNELEKAVKRTKLNKTSTVTVSKVRQKKPYTMVTVEVDNNIEGVGFAKSSPKDKWDSSIGFSIALFRAVRDAKHKQLNSNNTKHAYFSSESINMNYVLPDNK